MPLSKKKLEHIKIWNSVREIGGDVFGYQHREHRSKKKKTGKDRYVNVKKEKDKKIREDKLWDNIKKSINLIRNE